MVVQWKLNLATKFPPPSFPFPPSTPPPPQAPTSTFRQPPLPKCRTPAHLQLFKQYHDSVFVLYCEHSWPISIVCRFAFVRKHCSMHRFYENETALFSMSLYFAVFFRLKTNWFFLYKTSARSARENFRSAFILRYLGLDLSVFFKRFEIYPVSQYL